MPIQTGILQELRSLQEAGKLNPQDEEESRQKFPNYFDLKDFMLQQLEDKRIVVKFHDKFARHRFDIILYEEVTVKLTPKNDSPANNESLPTPVNLKEDILSPNGITPQIWIYYNTATLKSASSIFAQKKLTRN